MTTPSLTDLQALCDKAKQAFNALSHSAQTDDPIDRQTACWARDEGYALLTALPALIARVAELEREIEEAKVYYRAAEGVAATLQSRLATVERAFETKEVRDGVTTSTHARHNLEGAIIDIERQGKADAVSLRTLHRVAAQLAAIERALAPPVTTKESGG